MQFCPVCSSFCANNYQKKIAVCQRCGHESEREIPNGFVNKRVIDDKFVVINDELRERHAFPRRKSLCSKCGYKEAYVSLVGSSDETDYEVERFSCALCGYSWRDNT